MTTRREERRRVCRRLQGQRGLLFWERDTHGEGPALRGRRRVCLRPLLACPEERERDFLFNRGGGWERDNTCRAERGRTANGTPHVGGEELFRSVRVNGEEYAFGSCVSVLFDERGDPPMRWMICLPFWLKCTQSHTCCHSPLTLAHCYYTTPSLIPSAVDTNA